MFQHPTANFLRIHFASNILATPVFCAPTKNKSTDITKTKPKQRNKNVKKYLEKVQISSYPIDNPNQKLSNAANK